MPDSKFFFFFLTSFTIGRISTPALFSPHPQPSHLNRAWFQSTFPGNVPTLVTVPVSRPRTYSYRPCSLLRLRPIEMFVQFWDSAMSSWFFSHLFTVSHVCHRKGKNFMKIAEVRKTVKTWKRKQETLVIIKDDHLQFLKYRKPHTNLVSLCKLLQRVI